MKFDRFTLKAQEVLATAQQIAMAKSHTVLTPLHLLGAICKDEEGSSAMIVKKIGGNISQIRSMAEDELGRLPQAKGDIQLMPDASFNQVVLDAQNRADAMED
ncbi:MAG: Clp protease N-terminal domain-containing protein, partial [Planctomycetota bacterium]